MSSSIKLCSNNDDDDDDEGMYECEIMLVLLWERGIMVSKKIQNRC